MLRLRIETDEWLVLPDAIRSPIEAGVSWTGSSVRENSHTRNYRCITRIAVIPSLRVKYPQALPMSPRGASQGLSKPSDSGAPIVFPESEQRMVRDLPVWKTLSGKRVAVERGRYFSLGEGGNVANLPLPPGAADRFGHGTRYFDTWGSGRIVWEGEDENLKFLLCRIREASRQTRLFRPNNRKSSHIFVLALLVNEIPAYTPAW